MKLKHGLLFIYLLFTGLTEAQVQSFIADKSLSIETDFSIEVFNSESGLPQNSILNISQGEDGYLWIATFNGLARFDGMSFKLFNSQTTGGLITNTIMEQKQDSKKNLWLLDDAGHLVKYDGVNFTGFEKSFGNLKIKSFCFAEDGTLYIATTNNEIYTVSENILDFVFRLNQTVVREIRTGKNNSVLILTANGLFELKNGNAQKVEGVPDINITSISYDIENFLWVCTKEGVFKIDKSKAEKILLPDENFNSAGVQIFIDRQNRKWFYNGFDGIYVLGVNDFSQISEENGLTSNGVRYIFQDKEDNIWVGTNNAGLNKLHYKIFSTFSVEDGLIADGVAPIMKSREGTVYVGNNCGGINKIISGKIIKDEIPKLNNCVWTLMEDHDFNLWVGTYGGGLFKYNDGFETEHYFKANGLSDEVVMALFQSSDKRIWVGTDKSVFLFSQDSLKPFKHSIIKSKVSYFIEGNDKSIWIATNNGLYQIIGDEVNVFTTYNGLPSNIIRSLYFDKENALWIGTVGGGFSRYKDGKFLSLKNIPELSTIDVFCIAEDDANSFWFTTNRGIYSIKKQELNDGIEGRKSYVTFKYFDRKDGLKTNEFNSGFQPNFLKEDDSHFWFPSIKGASILNTKRIVPNDYSPKILIESVIVDDKALPSATPFIIARTNKTIVINYTSPRFTNPQKTYFQYKLEGYNSDWQPATTERLARYFNLPPKNYTFKVRIYGNPDSEKNISLQIPLPFWQTQWFLILLYLSGIGSLALIAWLRIKRIRKQEESKTNLNKKLAEFELRALQAQMNPHFLFNCLNTIKYFITTNNHIAANKYLIKFSKLLRMFLDHSTSNTVTLEDEINLLRLYIELEQMRFDEGFHFHLQVDDKIEYKNIEIPGTLFQPFVENAINHGLVNLNRKGNLTLIFEQGDGVIRGIVDDDGIGRKASAELKHSLPPSHISRGTQLIDDRIKTLNYIRGQSINIEIIDKVDENGTGNGTRVIVTIPI